MCRWKSFGTLSLGTEAYFFNPLDELLTNVSSIGLLGDYSKQARAYDSTRGASPSVLGPLREALSGAPGPALLDVGGGTGNYAQALAADGWQPLVADRSPQMLAQAEAKGLATVRADATELPFADESVDAAMLVAMIHHVDEPERALAEARRVLRPGGHLALMAFTREDIDDSWCMDYFPVSQPWMYETHPPLRELLAELPGARRVPVIYSDLQDGSMAALLGHPEKLLESERRSQTSFFERMERDHPDELRTGLERLERELGEGRAPRTSGGASMIAWTKG
jgi:ubiquinone/menaquinone biosynthesis C-methylase UbiE